MNYLELYENSIAEKEKFWAEQAQMNSPLHFNFSLLYFGLTAFQQVVF